MTSVFIKIITFIKMKSLAVQFRVWLDFWQKYDLELENCYSTTHLSLARALED